ncbi:hypothetical protein PoB_002318800 [Plakobranchus ocellatus]|uniref:Uncharacterized protein n=1 Tax=Plakobranchus ocellatus TaxID=259542 RepID=A0AAV3ZQC4_9GAST|nr:hypothetical protein PoB_002318800 [Plakobranchus ocellatus]
MLVGRHNSGCVPTTEDRKVGVFRCLETESFVLRVEEKRELTIGQSCAAPSAVLCAVVELTPRNLDGSLKQHQAARRGIEQANSKQQTANSSRSISISSIKTTTATATTTLSHKTVRWFTPELYRYSNADSAARLMYSATESSYGGPQQDVFLARFLQPSLRGLRGCLLT